MFFLQSLSTHRRFSMSASKKFRRPCSGRSSEVTL